MIFAWIELARYNEQSCRAADLPACGVLAGAARQIMVVMPPTTTAPSPTAFINACSTGDAQKVERLIHGGAAADTRDKYGLTGLIWAGRKGRVEVAEVLLSHGADIEGTDVRGRTSLFHAVTYKRYKFVEYLAEQGANVNPVDSHGWTPLDFASRNHNIKMAASLERLGARRAATEA
jgi:ankyrin repeat protein